MIESAQSPEERMMLVSYLASKIGVAPAALVGQMPFEIVAVKNGDKAVGAVLYINFRDTSIEMACAGERGWLTKGNLRELFEYPFYRLKVETVLSMVVRRNKEARAFNTKLGFTELCVIPSRMRETDTILYGMTRSQCAWIETAQAPPLNISAPNGAFAHGQVSA